MRVADEFSVNVDVEGGKLHLPNRRLFADLVRTLRPGPYELTISRLRATRSVQANRFYWGVVVQLISEYTGFTPEEVHEWAKAKFLPKRLALLGGNGEVVDEYVIGGSTRKLKTDEFYDYVEKVRTFAQEQLGLIMPEPEANWRETQPDEEPDTFMATGKL
jgi:hypothetical protein